MRCLLLMLAICLLKVESTQECTHPQAEDGDQFNEGCLQKICKAGVWRTSLASNLCCYDKTAYTINTTISSIMSEDMCVRTTIDCVEDTHGQAKMIHSMKNFCEKKMEAREGCRKDKPEKRAPPSFEIKTRTQTVLKGESAVLSCEANGDKPIGILWKMNNKRLDSLVDPRYTVREEIVAEGVLSTISIKSSERADSALFTCVATNAFGNDDTIINLIIQEVPETPYELKVLEKSGRNVKLSWQAPYNGNSNLTRYHMEFKPTKGTWQKDVDRVLAGGDERIGVVTSLLPGQSYHLRIVAENEIGFSAPSDTITVQTYEEAPSGPPVDCRVSAVDQHKLRVEWKPPLKEHWNGDILGYYLGYKKTNKGDNKPYNFETVEFIKEHGQQHSITISNLEIRTEYGIVVQAFNKIGQGPMSEEVRELTLWGAPTISSPAVTTKPKCVEPSVPDARSFLKVSAGSVTLFLDAWQDGGCPMINFVLEYKPMNQKEWTLVSNNVKPGGNFVILDLNPATWYNLKVTTHNNAGFSIAEYEFATLTSSGGALGPARELSGGKKSSRNAVPPHMVPISFGRDVLNKGENAQALCVVRKGDEPLEILWTFNGMYISSDLGILTTSFGKRTSLLIIDSVEPRHQGTYTCTAKNLAGLRSTSVDLKVNDK